MTQLLWNEESISLSSFLCQLHIGLLLCSFPRFYDLGFMSKLLISFRLFFVLIIVITQRYPHPIEQKCHQNTRFRPFCVCVGYPPEQAKTQVRPSFSCTLTGHRNHNSLLSSPTRRSYPEGHRRLSNRQMESVCLWPPKLDQGSDKLMVEVYWLPTRQDKPKPKLFDKRPNTQMRNVLMLKK